MMSKICCTVCGSSIEFDPNEIESDFIFCGNCGNKNDISSLHSNMILHSVQSEEKTASPFEEVDEEKQMVQKINESVQKWNDAIRETTNTKSEFTDSFACGMPAWDLLPPQMMIKRKHRKNSSNNN